MPQQPVPVQVRSLHVVGVHDGWTNDGRNFYFPAAALSRMLVSATGTWRLRRGEGGGWQEHGPNSGDWTDLDRIRLAGTFGYRLDRYWGWQTVSLIGNSTPAAGPAATVKAPVLPEPRGKLPAPAVSTAGPPVSQE